MGSLDGKVALVTGASSGIGEATVRALVAEGAKVGASARRADRLSVLAAEAPDSILPIVGDVRNEADAARMVEETVAKFGRIDILVNNAGVMLLGPIVDADTEDWRRMIDTNVVGLLYATHKALPHMIRQGSGHILNISSTAGRVVSVNAGVYNLTKFGINAFAESLRMEVHAKGIRVTTLGPGVVQTELRDHITVPEVKADINAWAEGMRQLQSEDIAKAVVWAVTQPDHVSVSEILIRPSDQQR